MKSEKSVEKKYGAHSESLKFFESVEIRTRSPQSMKSEKSVEIIKIRRDRATARQDVQR